MQSLQYQRLQCGRPLRVYTSLQYQKVKVTSTAVCHYHLPLAAVTPATVLDEARHTGRHTRGTGANHTLLVYTGVLEDIWTWDPVLELLEKGGSRSI